ncbi:MAG: hypothetical protein ABWX63_11215 [Paeniglutamicibacter terrestris]|uniref:Uncharacterized protein n=1 Tax=Paeniglutamicibacter terrestris TaxID=2723403 RepID=A0ABX1FYW7_9MICC|nr:hypothetical protein [Paeniglutamicibacter terrestris]NKG19139.1 hypothetical protein [Paeniglutamicibacter terrestris]
MALTPLWSTAMGDSVPMLITAGALLFVVGMINLAGPNLYGIEIGQLLAAGIAIMLPWLGNFAGSNIPAMTAWIGGGIAVIATVLAMKPSVDASHRLARQ